MYILRKVRTHQPSTIIFLISLLLSVVFSLFFFFLLFSFISSNCMKWPRATLVVYSSWNQFHLFNEHMERCDCVWVYGMEFIAIEIERGYMWIDRVALKKEPSSHIWREHYFAPCLHSPCFILSVSLSVLLSRSLTYAATQLSPYTAQY